MTDASALTTSLDGGILTVRLSRPESRNAQTPGLWRDLAAIGRDLDPRVRAVVLCAEGKSFSAGLDRRMFTPEGIPGESSMMALARLAPEELDAQIAVYQEAFAWWRRSDVVTVAAVQGHAVGAGFQLALACDAIVVAEDVAFAMKEPSLGLVPDLGGTLPLVEAVGYSRALELVLSGRWVGAEEAVRIGLALRAVSAEELEASARQVAASCVTAPAGVVAATKALLRDAPHPSGYARAHAAQLADERAAQGVRIRELVAMMLAASRG